MFGRYRSGDLLACGTTLCTFIKARISCTKLYMPTFLRRTPRVYPLRPLVAYDGITAVFAPIKGLISGFKPGQAAAQRLADVGDGEQTRPGRSATLFATLPREMTTHSSLINARPFAEPARHGAGMKTHKDVQGDARTSCHRGEKPTGPGRRHLRLQRTARVRIFRRAAAIGATGWPHRVR